MRQNIGPYTVFKFETSISSPNLGLRIVTLIVNAEEGSFFWYLCSFSVEEGREVT